MDLANEILIGHDERAEVERVGIADARDEQCAGPVALLLVDGQPEPDVLVVDDAGLAGIADGVDEGGIEGGHVVQGAHHRVPDEVGEADLGSGRAGQLVVEDLAVHLEQPGGHTAHTGRRGDRQAGLHVGHNPRRRALEHNGLFGARARPGRRAGRRRGGWRVRLGRWDGCRTVIGEEFPPTLTHRVRVDQEPVEHVINQPGVRAERARCRFRLRHVTTLPAVLTVPGRGDIVPPAHDLSGRPPRH